MKKYRVYTTIPAEFAKKVTNDHIDIYHFIASAANTLGLNDIAFQYIRLRKLKSGDVRVYLTGKKNK